MNLEHHLLDQRTKSFRNTHHRNKNANFETIVKKESVGKPLTDASFRFGGRHRQDNQ